MDGDWMRLSQEAKEIDQKRQELRRAKLTEDEKQTLRAKIAERPQKTARNDIMIKVAIYFYMVIVIFGFVGPLTIIFIHEDIIYSAESVRILLPCLFVIAFCVLWLKLSNIRKSRGLLATIPGFILFVPGSVIISFSILLGLRSATESLIMGVPALAASYHLCFKKGKNIDN